MGPETKTWFILLGSRLCESNYSNLEQTTLVEDNGRTDGKIDEYELQSSAD